VIWAEAALVDPLAVGQRMTFVVSDTAVEEICRKMGISEPTFYRWKKPFAGMGVPEIRRLKPLEDENSKLKRLVADLTLDRAMLQDVLKRKW
jgi:putative transposase